MKRRYRILTGLLFPLFLLTACGSNDPIDTEPADTHPDTVTDTSVDTSADTSIDTSADTSADSTEDTAADTAAETDTLPEGVTHYESINTDLSTDVTSAGRLTVNLNDGWVFAKRAGRTASRVNYDDSDWEAVTLPHTWNAEDGTDGGNNYDRCEGWYRKSMTVPAAYAGKSVWLEFQGANTKTTVYVNGTLVGTHQGGYSTFRFDLSDYLDYGRDNLIAVSVSNEYDPTEVPLSADFTFYGGIYRNVNLLVADPVHIDLSDAGSTGVTAIPSDVSAESAKVNVHATLCNEGERDRTVTVTLTLREPLGFTMSEYEQQFFDVNTLRFDPEAMGDGSVHATETMEVTVPAGGTYDLSALLSIDNPHLWNGLSDPFRYMVIVEISDGETVLDDVMTYIGVRTIEVKKDGGFYLNGESYPLRGVCKHQDREGMGNAITAAEMAEDMSLIYEIGANTVRLSHYPHAPYVYELCDKYGIVVYAEIPFVNGFGGSGTVEKPDDTLAGFMEVTKQQLTEMIKQLRNRPSVAVYGLSNETQTANHRILVPLTRELDALAHELDSTRYTTIATFSAPGELLAGDLLSWNIYTTADRLATLMNQYKAIMNGQSVSAVVDRYGDKFIQNYADIGYYDNLLDRPIGLSEYGTGGSIYQHTDNYSTTIWTSEWQPEEYHAYVHEKWAYQVTYQMDYTWGTYIWNMFDFGSDLRKEATVPGINTKGLMTYDRETYKDAFYIYKAYWSDETVLYINGANNTARTTTPTYFKVYANCDSVELFVDGQSLGTLTDNADQPTHVFEWKYRGKLTIGEHEIKAVGTRNGETYTDVLTLSIVKNSDTSLASSHLKVDNDKREIAYSSLLTVENLSDYLQNTHGGSVAAFATDGKTALTSGNIPKDAIIRVTSESGEVTADYIFVNADLTLGAILTTGGEQAENSADHMMDGDDSTRWAYAAEKTTVTLQLAHTSNLENLSVYWYGAGRKYYYTVEISTDGQTWTTVADHTAGAADRVTDDLGGAVASYIRLSISGSSANNGWVSIYELNLNGFAIGGTAYKVDEQAATITVKATAVEQIAKDRFIAELMLTDNATAVVESPSGATAYFINDGDTVTVTAGGLSKVYTIVFEEP